MEQTSFEIPYGKWLTIYYLGIFAFAELAFVTLASREYLQDVMGLSDKAIITSMMFKPNRETLEEGV